jgi:TetR/AcrR family transcriptional regulator, regulator of cefoperazone and chloramphenicol sensitivity
MPDTPDAVQQTRRVSSSRQPIRANHGLAARTTRRGASADSPLTQWPNLRDVQAAQTKARVLDVAVSCIDELGIARASLNEIARRAGTTWGAIQHHFGTRAELLVTVIERNFSELESKVRESAIAGGSPLERMQALADLLWEYCRDIRYRVTIEILLDLRRDPEASELVAHRIAHAADAMSVMWDDLCDEMLGTPQDHTVGRILFGAARGLALSRHMNTFHSDFTQERALLVQLLVRTVEDRTAKEVGRGR